MFLRLLTGYGNITPITKLGHILVIVYATFGIPIMLLFVSDIGKFDLVIGYITIYIIVIIVITIIMIIE